MPSRKTHDLLATVREYTDPMTGKKKKHRVNCGAMFQNDEGQIAVKIDLMPAFPEWSGFFNAFPVDSSRQHDRDRDRERR